MLHQKSKHQFIEDIGVIAFFATQIPLSIFTNLFHQRFEKHSMLESTLEILQQFYVQMKSEPHEFSVYTGDLSTYTLSNRHYQQTVELCMYNTTTGQNPPKADYCCGRGNSKPKNGYYSSNKYYPKHQCGSCQTIVITTDTQSFLPKTNP